MIACAISHPCTTFDKWRFLPIVDDAYDVVDAVDDAFLGSLTASTNLRERARGNR